MLNQSIPLKKDFKAYQVLALCYHFYNKGMYIDEIDSYYSPPHILFKSIDNLFNSSLRRTEFDLILNNNFTFSFDNYKQIYDSKFNSYNNFSKTSFKLKYNNVIFDNWTKCSERYYEDRLKEAYLKRTYNFKDNDNITQEEELQKYYKSQEDAVQKLKFYEENCIDIADILINSRYVRTTRYNKQITFDYMYGLKKYTNAINSYMKKGICNKDSIESIYKAFNEDMQIGKLYHFKTLKFLKRDSDILNITINKSLELSLYTSSLRNAFQDNPSDSIFNILVPIYEEIGGYNELQNVILHNRILTE